MKKLLALMLAVLMMAALFVGCGTKEADSDKKEPTKTETSSKVEKLTNENIVGNWTMEIDINKFIETMKSQGAMDDADADELAGMLATFEMFKAMNPQPLKINVEFTSGGEMKIDANSLVDAVVVLFDDMLDWLAKDDNLYTFLLSTQEVTREDIDQMLAQAGMTTAQYVDALRPTFNTIKEGLSDSADELSKTMSATKYEVDGNKLYNWAATETKSEKGAITFEYDGKTITVISIVADDQTINLEKGTISFKK